MLKSGEVRPAGDNCTENLPEGTKEKPKECNSEGGWGLILERELTYFVTFLFPMALAWGQPAQFNWFKEPEDSSGRP